MKMNTVLPASLKKDEQIAALVGALDAELAKVTALTPKNLHLPRLDELSGIVLDLLAWQFHVDFYDALSLTDKQKRAMIRQSISLHRIKGTRRAVEMVNAMFEREIKLDEWFEYGGEPGWFRCITTFFKSDKELLRWVERLYDAKNVRSWVQIILQKSLRFPAYVGIAQFRFGKIRLPMQDSIQYSANTIIDDVAGARYIIEPTQVTYIRDGESIIFPIANSYSDRLSLNLTFPNSRHMVSIKNPRADLTAEDINGVVQYAVDNAVFVDSEGRPVTGINIAKLASQSTSYVY